MNHAATQDLKSYTIFLILQGTPKCDLSQISALSFCHILMWLRKFWSSSCSQESFSQTKTKRYCFSLAAEIAIFLLLIANCRCASLFGSLFGGRLCVSREIDVFHLLQKNSQFFFWQMVELQDNVWKLRTRFLQTLFSGGLQG